MNADRKRIVIVGGGAGGLELATRLGDKLGKRGRASVTLVDRQRTLWKPLLHEVAASVMDPSVRKIDFSRSPTVWLHLPRRRMTGQTQRRVVEVSPFSTRKGAGSRTSLRSATTFRHRRISSQTNDFGTPGVREYACVETSAMPRCFIAGW